MRAAVLGHPVAHSLSPVLHRAAYAELGLAAWRYDAVDVTEEALAAFVDGLDDEWAGLSLTMPLKRAVLPLLDEASSLVRVVGAANTVVLGGSGAGAAGTSPRRARRGENTDVAGIVTALREAGVGGTGAAGTGGAGALSGCVLGGGATAAAAVVALAELGCVAPTVYVRSPARAAAVRDAARCAGARPVLSPWEQARGALAADVVVSTVPGDGAASLAAALESEQAEGEQPTADQPAARHSGSRQPSVPVLLDVVYTPWPTALATVWERLGGRVVGGFEMLLHQAAEQVRLMTGAQPPVAAMRAAGLAALAGR